METQRTRRIRFFLFVVILCSLCAALQRPRAANAAPETTTATDPAPTPIVIGRSVEGRPIEAFRFGKGDRKFVIVGATHGGPERNTQQLSRMLMDWYRSHSDEIPAAIRIYIIPVLNPDGDAIDSRQNAHGVDLNRNMDTTIDGCTDNDWQTTVFGAGGVVVDTGGPYADSEPESRIIRAFLLDAAAVVFIHSDAGLVFPPSCEDPVSIAFAQAYAAGAGYTYARYWEKYHITGGMHDWARGIDLPAIVPELLTGEDPEFTQNLNGLRAVFHNTDALIPAPSFRTVDGVTMPLPIWRFWRAYGAESLGPPLRNASVIDGVYIQDFTTARVRYDSAAEVHPVTLVAVPEPPLVGTAAPILDTEDIITNAANPFVVHDAFARYYRRVDGTVTLGVPRSDETVVSSPDGESTAQLFENGLIRYDSATNRIVRVPVVWQTAARAALTAPELSFQIR